MGKKGSASNKDWVFPRHANGTIDLTNGTYVPTRHEMKFKYRQESRMVAGCVKQADTDTQVKTRISPPFIYTGKFGWMDVVVAMVVVFVLVFVFFGFGSSFWFCCCARLVVTMCELRKIILVLRLFRFLSSTHHLASVRFPKRHRKILI